MLKAWVILLPHGCVVCRLTNIGNTSLVVDDITLDYWFNGPADSSVSLDQFRPVCSETTLGMHYELSQWNLEGIKYTYAMHNISSTLHTKYCAYLKYCHMSTCMNECEGLSPFPPSQLSVVVSS